MGDVRDLLIRIKAVDDATDVLENIKTLQDDISDTLEFSFNTTAIAVAQKAYEDAVKVISQPINTTAGIHVDSKAASDSIHNFANNSINEINKAASTINNTLSSALNVSGTAGVSNTLASATSNVTTGVASLTTAATSNNSTMDKLKGVWSGLGDAGSGVSKTINGVVDSFKQADVAIAAVVGLGTNKLFKSYALDDSMREQFKNEEYMQVQEYLKNKPDYIGEDTAQQILLTNKRTYGMNLKDSTDAINTLSQTRFSNIGAWNSEGMTTENAMARLNSMSASFSENVKKGKDVSGRQLTRLRSLGFGDVKGKDFTEAYNSLRASGDVKGRTKQEDIDKIFRKAVLDAAKRTMKPIDWGALSSTQKVELMQVRLENLSNTIADTVVPILADFVDWISRIIKIISEIPGATKFIAYTMIFTTLATIVARLSGTFGVLTTSINTASAALIKYKNVSLGLESFTGAKAALNSPLGKIGDFSRKSGLTNKYNVADDGAMIVAQTGIIGRMTASFKSAGGVITGVFALIKTGALGAFTAIKMGAISALVAIKAGIIANPIGAILLLITIIILLAYKFGYLKRAWDAFSNSNFGKDVIYAFYRLKTILNEVWAVVLELWHKLSSSVGGGILSFVESIVSVIANAYEKFDAFYTAMKGGDIGMKLETGGEFFESLGFLGPIFLILSGVFKLFKLFYDIGSTAFKVIKDILTRIYDVFSGLWRWLIKAIPGAEKEQKRQEMVAQAKKENLGVTSAGSFVKLDNKGMPTKIGADSLASTKLKSLQTEYNALPGFAEGIADAVKAGLSSIGDAIATKIKDALPDFTPLKEAIASLVDAILKFNIPGIGSIEDNMSVVTPESKVYWPVDGGEPITEAEYDKLSKVGRSSSYIYDSSGNNPLDKDSSDNIPSADVGGQIKSDGLLFGHKDEPIVPAKIASSSNLLRNLESLAKTDATTVSTSNNPTFNINFYNNGQIDQKTKNEFEKMIKKVTDDYLSKQLRHRQGH